ncbi:MAG: hypothetical protein ABSB82_06300 [Terriglobia bacterium]
MTRKRKKVLVGNIEVTPLTAKQHRRLEERIKKRHEKLRKRYREIHGKTVDWISYSFEDGSLYIDIRFKDKTDFSLRFSPQIVTDGIDLSDMSSGNFKLIRE